MRAEKAEKARAGAEVLRGKLQVQLNQKVRLKCESADAGTIKRGRTGVSCPFPGKQADSMVPRNFNMARCGNLTHISMSYVVHTQKHDTKCHAVSKQF